MFTRCPQCKTVHPLNAGLLSNARGLVQCGQCGRSFSALNFLFDESPAGGEQPSANDSETALPVLGSDSTATAETGTAPAEHSEAENIEGNEQQTASEPDAASPVTDTDEEGETDTEIPPSEDSEPEASKGDEPLTVNEPDAASPVTKSDNGAKTGADAAPPENKKSGNNKPEILERKPRRLAWRLATVLLVLITIIHIIWTFREPLLANPVISSWMKQAGWLQVEQQGLLKDPKQIQLVSRDMHTHPTRSGILVLSLTFVNLAPRNQVFPELEVTLLDASSQPVAQRRLQPTDYLRPGADTGAGMAADVYLPVLLELGDPGDQAVGFEIRFL